MYIFLTFAWCILGAILYPEKFLAYASAAIVFLGTILQSYRKVSNFVNNLEAEIDKIINDKLLSIYYFATNKAKREIQDALKISQVKS
jgi:hypothetical protein